MQFIYAHYNTEEKEKSTQAYKLRRESVLTLGDNNSDRLYQQTESASWTAVRGSDLWRVVSPRWRCPVSCLSRRSVTIYWKTEVRHVITIWWSTSDDSWQIRRREVGWISYVILVFATVSPWGVTSRSHTDVNMVWQLATRVTVEFSLMKRTILRYSRSEESVQGICQYLGHHKERGGRLHGLSRDSLSSWQKRLVAHLATLPAPLAISWRRVISWKIPIYKRSYHVFFDCILMLNNIALWILDI